MADVGLQPAFICVTGRPFFLDIPFQMKILLLGKISNHLLFILFLKQPVGNEENVSYK